MSITDRMRNWTVLAVDDDADNLSVAQQILEFFGAKLYTAADGEQAMKLLETISPTLILTDLSMPVMDGWQLLNKIRETPALEKLPVIALTAHAMNGDRERAMAAGFDQYITKPFRLQSFLQELEECIDRMVVEVA